MPRNSSDNERAYVSDIGVSPAREQRKFLRWLRMYFIANAPARQVLISVTFERKKWKFLSSPGIYGPH